VKLLESILNAYQSRNSARKLADLLSSFGLAVLHDSSRDVGSSYARSTFKTLQKVLFVVYCNIFFWINDGQTLCFGRKDRSRYGDYLIQP